MSDYTDGLTGKVDFIAEGDGFDAYADDAIAYISAREGRGLVLELGPSEGILDADELRQIVNKLDELNGVKP